MLCIHFYVKYLWNPDKQCKLETVDLSYYAFLCSSMNASHISAFLLRKATDWNY